MSAPAGSITNAWWRPVVVREGRYAFRSSFGSLVVRVYEVWSASKLTRPGDRGTTPRSTPDDVRALCAAYEVDPETGARLEAYAVVTRTKRDWWLKPEFRPVISPGFRAFLDLEVTATAVQTYESEFVPGLLQTGPYVRVILQRAHPGLPG